MFPSIVERVIVAGLLALFLASGVAAIAFYGQRQEARKQVTTLTEQKGQLEAANSQLKASLSDQSNAVEQWKKAATDAQARADAAGQAAQAKQLAYSKAAGIVSAQKPTADMVRSFSNLRKTYEEQAK
ncbi:hypothetical protein [Burkholderia phage BCSR129]|nr:hypothetical protein [Burkholderia phage BCSR129]